MPNIAEIYGEATSFNRMTSQQTKVNEEERKALSHQHQVLHRQWLDNPYTQNFLKILQDKIDELNAQLKSSINIEPSRYHVLQNNLLRKHLLEQVLKCAQDGSTKLQD